MEDKDEILLRENGWTIECQSPFEIRHMDGSFATGHAAWIVLRVLKEENDHTPTYFVLRHRNCGTYMDGKHFSDIIGITTDEEYAKKRVSVFCSYEPAILLNE